MYSKTEQAALNLAEPVANENGCYIYDVEYVKEGGSWYLRIFADKDGGITIDECEAISRKLSEKLDEKDFIKQDYLLEVSSPGIERRLRQEKHFEMYKGETVDVGLYKAVNGTKTLCGTLLGLSGDEISIDCEGDIVKIKPNEAAYVKLHFEF